MKKLLLKLLALTLCIGLFLLTACTPIDNSGQSAEDDQTQSQSDVVDDDENSQVPDDNSTSEEVDDTSEESDEKDDTTSEDEQEEEPKPDNLVDYAIYYQTDKYDEIKSELGELLGTQPDELNDYTIYLHEDVSMSVDQNGTIQTITLHKNAPQNYYLLGVTTGMTRSETISVLGEPFNTDDSTDMPSASYELEVTGGMTGLKMYFDENDNVIEVMLLNYIPSGMIDG